MPNDVWPSGYFDKRATFEHIAHLTKSVDQADRRLLDDIYRAFNSRDIDRAVARFAPDLDWPNAFEGGLIRRMDVRA